MNTIALINFVLCNSMTYEYVIVIENVQIIDNDDDDEYLVH